MSSIGDIFVYFAFILLILPTIPPVVEKFRTFLFKIIPKGLKQLLDCLHNVNMKKVIDILKAIILILAFFGWLGLVFSNEPNILLIIIASIAFVFFIDNENHKIYEPNQVYEWAKIISYVVILGIAIYPFYWINKMDKVEHISGYVYAFPNKDNDKNYRLKADMTKTGSRIFVNKIYFYNGGFITFDEDYNSEQSEIEEGAYITTDDKSCVSHYDKNNDEEWCIRYFGEEIKSFVY